MNPQHTIYTNADINVSRVTKAQAYEFLCKETTLAMVEGSEKGVGSALCGSVRAKVNRHDWGSGALRLLISGEGLSASAHKYARGLQQPPTAVRAREPRQVNGRVANDGPAWNVPAGLVLVGVDAINEVGTETYVWRTGDPHRSSRELQDAVLALVFLGGLWRLGEGRTRREQARSVGGASTSRSGTGSRSRAYDPARPRMRKVKTLNKGGLSPWEGDADTGRSLKGDEGVVFLTGWQASQIVKEHNDLYKEWLKKNPNNN
ncbi:unnamed protein product [Ectocarpus sp. CCAP 1310/34]|nr:unnamed protein product [Ectocarpus sp. CCAP 1310/34]